MPTSELATTDEQRTCQDLSDPDVLEYKGIITAEKFLGLRGYEILERCWSCECGDVDFIALDPDDGALVFFIVKTHLFNPSQGVPIDEGLTPTEKARIGSSALCYLMVSDFDDDQAIRFDRINVTATANGRAMLRHEVGCSI